MSIDAIRLGGAESYGDVVSEEMLILARRVLGSDASHEDVEMMAEDIHRQRLARGLGGTSLLNR
jgi:hypothetical protein